MQIPFLVLSRSKFSFPDKETGQQVELDAIRVVSLETTLDPEEKGLDVVKLPVPKGLRDSLPLTGYPALATLDCALVGDSKQKSSLALRAVIGSVRKCDLVGILRAQSAPAPSAGK